MDVLKNLERIKKNISKLPPEKLQELEDFIEFLLLKSTPKPKVNVKKLAGIWEGLGFENLDLEKELSEIRSEFETSMNEKTI